MLLLDSSASITTKANISRNPSKMTPCQQNLALGISLSNATAASSPAPLSVVEAICGASIPSQGLSTSQEAEWHDFMSSSQERDATDNIDVAASGRAVPYLISLCIKKGTQSSFVAHIQGRSVPPSTCCISQLYYLSHAFETHLQKWDFTITTNQHSYSYLQSAVKLDPQVQGWIRYMESL